MSTIEEAVIARLTGDAVVAGMAGSRIQVGHLVDQDSEMPAVTMYRFASVQSPTTSGPASDEEAQLTIVSHADTLKAAVLLDRAVVKSLEAEVGGLLDAAIAGSDRHLFDEDTRKHRVERDWRIWGQTHPVAES